MRRQKNYFFVFFFGFFLHKDYTAVFSTVSFLPLLSLLLSVFPCVCFCIPLSLFLYSPVSVSVFPSSCFCIPLCLFLYSPAAVSVFPCFRFSFPLQLFLYSPVSLSLFPCVCCRFTPARHTCARRPFSSRGVLVLF